MEHDDDALPSLRRPLPPAFRRWEVVVPPGGARSYDAAEWRGAIVVLDRGQLDLVCTQGRRTRLTAGAVVFLSELPLRELANAGPGPAVLIAVARRADAPAVPAAADEFSPPPPSQPPNDDDAPDPDPRSPSP